jgi:hypothetical protein
MQAFGIQAGLGLWRRRECPRGPAKIEGLLTYRAGACNTRKCVGNGRKALVLSGYPADDISAGYFVSSTRAVSPSRAHPLRFFLPTPAGFFQFPLHSAVEAVVPVEPAKCGASRLGRKFRQPYFFAGRRLPERFRLRLWRRSPPPFAIFRVFQIIDGHSLPRRREPTTAGWRPPAAARTNVRRECGSVGRGDQEAMKRKAWLSFAAEC